MGMPYCWANVPTSGCRFAFWVMLPIQVELWALTSRVEMSALNTLSAGNSPHVVPGSGCAATGITAEDDNIATTNAAATWRAGLGVICRSNAGWRSRLRQPDFQRPNPGLVAPAAVVAPTVVVAVATLTVPIARFRVDGSRGGRSGDMNHDGLLGDVGVTCFALSVLFVAASAQVVVTAGVADFVVVLVVDLADLVVLVALLVVRMVSLLIFVITLTVAISVTTLLIAVVERIARHDEREDQDETYRKSRNNGFLPQKSRALHASPRRPALKGPP